MHVITVVGAMSKLFKIIYQTRTVNKSGCWYQQEDSRDNPTGQGIAGVPADKALLSHCKPQVGLTDTPVVRGRDPAQTSWSTSRKWRASWGGWCHGRRDELSMAIKCVHHWHPTLDIHFTMLGALVWVPIRMLQSGRPTPPTFTPQDPVYGPTYSYIVSIYQVLLMHHWQCYSHSRIVARERRQAYTTLTHLADLRRVLQMSKINCTPFTSNFTDLKRPL